jgi:glycosyltransferase involved in cell wall biosynthesis
MEDATHERKLNLLIALEGLGIGGAEVVVQRLAQTIDPRRFNLTIGCIKRRGLIGGQLTQAGVKVVVLSDKAGGKNTYFSFLRLLKLIREQRIHVVHTHTTDSFVDAAICKLLIPRLKLIHTFHFGNYPHRPRLTLWLERLSCRLADRLVAVGEQQREQLRSVYGLRSIERIWNGVSYQPGNPGHAFRQRIGAENHVLIGTTATLKEQKGLFDFLAVARKVLDARNNVRFVVVGDGPLRSALEARRRELGLDDAVNFCGLIENAAQVALPAFDIFFQSSLWEAMSISLLEAMAAGKAIVTTRVGDAAWMIQDGVDGLLVEPRDLEGMATALDRLIRDRDLHGRLGRAAASKAQQQFTVEQMTQAYEEIYVT